MLSRVSSSPVVAIFCLAIVMSAAVFVATLVQGMSNFTGPLISLAFILVGVIVAKIKPRAAEMGSAAALIGQAIAFTAAFEGHPWQLDSHMLFFALLAACVALRSIPAIFVATAITAAHHLSLTIMMPALVYPSVGLIENLGRTVFHAVIVIIETAALTLTVISLKRLDAKTARQNAELEESLQLAERARSEAEAATETAQEHQAEAEAATQRAEQLLIEAKEAEADRALATQEREEAQKKLATKQQAETAEQRDVVDAISKALERLRGGDLTARILEPMPEVYEELRASFNAATEALERTVAEVAAESTVIESKIEELTSAAGDLAVRTERQAMTLTSATDELNGLTVKVTNSADAVSEANASAQLAQANASESEKIVSEASEVMSKVHDESKEIAMIVQVIDEIAFQTNLLALNAGVEAARAGEAGSGFAVVASEVRALAQRSSDSATSIRTMIERSGTEVEKGTSKIAETVASLKEVLKAVLDITSKTDLITQSSTAQKDVVDHLNEKISELDSATQQNAAMFEETSAACTSLLQSATTLRSLTENFTVGENDTEVREVA